MKNSSDVSMDDIKHHFNDTLIEFFYLFGIEPNCLNISEFTNEKKYLSTDFKQVQLLTKFPPSDKFQSDIDPKTLMSHCFPKGYNLIENEKQPNDEFIYFHLNNLLSISNSDKTLYFVCAIIYEPIKSYLDLKFQHKIPEFDEKDKKAVNFHKIYAPKALCFSSFVSFPLEIKTLLVELLKYIRSNNITIPIELIIENIVYGMPRPLKAYFYVSCSKTNGLIPNQSKDIDFTLSEINQYYFNSFPYQYILSIFSSNSILGIFRCILLEFPVLFFSANKEQLTTVVEIFLNLIYPFEYQYPHCSILPDCNAGLIEMEKSFIFGINQKFEKKSDEDGNNQIVYFSDMNINITNRVFLLCDIDEKKASGYCGEKDMYHVVNFEDLGIYPESVIDPSLSVSKDAYTGKVSEITEETQLPDRYTEKLKNKLDAFIKDNKKMSLNYNINTNKKIGTEFFYYYFASCFISYNNYLFNKKEDIERICGDLMVKKPDEINIENLFDVRQFLQDYKNDTVFYQKFFNTKMFKNFIIRKYLNDPLDKYTFLNFDEKILEKKNKKLFAKKIKIEFFNSTMFQSTHPYIMRLPTKSNFSEEEFTKIINNKNILLNEYYQSIDDKKKIKYIIFPKIIYDNKFFKEKYNHSTNFAQNNQLIKLLKNYHELEDILTTEKSNKFFSIYNGDFVNRYMIDITKFEYHNEVYNTLLQTWLIVFILTFHYCDETEKLYRFEQLIRFIPNVIDREEKLLSILLVTIKEYGNEEMEIRLFELIKNLNYGQYCCLTSKYRADKKLNWDTKTIDIGSKVKISYYREKQNYEKQVPEVQEIIPNKYDIKSIRKRTFYTGKEKSITKCYREKIIFGLVIKCQKCQNTFSTTDITGNIKSKTKETYMICSKCKVKLEPINYAFYGEEKIKFKIFSILDMFKMGKDLLKKYGTKIDLDVLRSEYQDFFWNCILYFNFNNLAFEIILKYKDTIPQLKRSFNVLEISKQ